METLLSFVKDFTGQLMSLDDGPLVFLLCIIVGYIIKSVEVIPNKFIPLVVLAVGVTGMVLLGSTSQVSHEAPNPQIRLGIVGAIIAFAAWLAHAQVLKRIEDRFGLFKNETPKTPPVGP